MRRLTQRHTAYGSFSHRPWAMALVLCVFLVSALASTVSRARAWALDSRLVEVCTSQGSSFVNLEGDSRDSGSGPNLDHCPFCLQPADKGAAPPPESAFSLLALGRHIEGPAKQAVFANIDITHSPPARGPPAIF